MASGNYWQKHMAQHMNFQFEDGGGMLMHSVEILLSKIFSLVQPF